MKRTSLVAAGLAVLICQTPVLADTSEKSIAERLADMERRIQHLEQRLSDQDKVIVEKDRVIRELSAQSEEKASWPDSVEISGLVEVEASHAEPYEGDSESDAVLATVELGVAAQITDWVSGEVLFLFEEDENDNNIDVDIGTLTIAPPDGPWFITGGRMYLPFGVYETTMISDPLTLELGEIRETALMFGVEGENLYGAAFLYNGDNSKDDDNRVDNFGAVVGYAMEGDGMEFGLDLAYINDIGDTDTLQDAVAGNLEAAGQAAFDGQVEDARRKAMAKSVVRKRAEYEDDVRMALTYNDFREVFYTVEGDRATWAPTPIWKDVDAEGDFEYVKVDPTAGKPVCDTGTTTSCYFEYTYPGSADLPDNLSDPIYTDEDDDVGAYYDGLRGYAAGIDDTAGADDLTLKAAYERLEKQVNGEGAMLLAAAEEARTAAGDDAAGAKAEELGGSEPETYNDHVSGFAASARLRYGDVALMAEYLGATERFQSTALAYGGSVVDGEFVNRGAKPSSWMIEAAYDFMLGDRPATVAVGYQATDDAVGLELPESRFMLSAGVELMDSVALAVEWAHDKDYDTDEWSDCALVDGSAECAFAGTDKNADTITVQLAAEF